MTKCELYRLSATAYCDWCKSDPDFAWRQHAAQNRELTDQMQQTAELACLSVRERLQQALWRLARAAAPQEKRAVRLQLPLPQKEFAGLLGMSPEHLNRLLRELEDQKLLRRDKGWLVLPAPERLWRAPEPAPPHSDKNGLART